MRTPAPAECLRAARALLGLSQRKAASDARLTQRLLSLAENAESGLLETNLQLVDFYISKGIEFLGEISIGKDVERAGARFAVPPSLDADAATKSSFRAVDFPLAFRAARALMKKEQSEVAHDVGLLVGVIRDLERGRSSSQSQAQLQQWYESNGIEFIGWRDIPTGNYYGVGVRWRTKPKVSG
jgi:transcriptional regulator with XRE-family HTH domain